ncbi:hypothetical protein CgunFtcFv8_019521 [Champsocephalus gunnari]|uniref:Uncharacterized protein n=1 Tax=Champsocephalus gunnari TaxID=52237 RepID=A0AAN8DFM0_CHAGU|nr:hypothetical protein CgunFtcFv8_019521 [Champsocephalus gunnari]
MNRTDLVQRLSDVSSGTKVEPLPSLIQRVETMASVIELLLETLKDLKAVTKQLRTQKETLRGTATCSDPESSNNGSC